MRKTRRRALVALVVAAVAASLAPPLAPTEGAQAAADPRPNVVVIMTDDQTLAQMAALPKTRELLGDHGLTFTDAVVSYPLCCPSRATFLTGQYPQNNGVRSNVAADDDLPLPRELVGDGPEAWPAFADDAESRTVAVALEADGYHTGLLGKYLNGYNASAPVPPGWSDWRAVVGPASRYRDTRLNINGTVTGFPGRFQTDLFAEQAGDMITDASALASPFFFTFAFSAPHESEDGRRSYAARHADLYPGLRAPRGPSYNEGRSAKPPFLRALYPPMGAPQRAHVDQRWRNAFRALASVDDAVSTIVDTLADTGELGRTVLMFTSDNGLFHGQHRVPGGKYLPYEPSVRVPLLIRGPMIPARLEGTRVGAAVANVDLAPTILDLAGAAPVAPVDGRSLRPLLEGQGAGGWQGAGDVWHPNDTRHRPVYVMGVGRRGQDPAARRRLNVTYSGVRSSDGWLYVRWEDLPRTRELYDLDADPHQLENLAGRRRYASVQRRLEAQRHHLTRCAGRSCDVPPYGFLDLPRGRRLPAWFAPAQWGEGEGLGVAYPDGTFRPGRPLLRSHGLLWLWRLAGSPSVRGNGGFTDVPRALAPAAAWAVSEAVIGAGNRFRPDAPLTRRGLALWLWNRAGRPAAPGPRPSDVPAGHHAAAAIRWAVADPGGPGGRPPVIPVRPDGTFRPDAAAARAVALTALHTLEG